MDNKGRVLIVEDDQYIREMYATVLENQGYEVQQAPDGATGLAEAQQGGWSVILLDLMMPQMDGLSFLSKLKESPAKKKNGPIIVLSNLAYSEAKDEAMELGAVDFMVKADLEPKEVVEMVAKAMGRKAG